MLKLDGQLVAETRRNQLALEIRRFTDEKGRPPGLTVILVGDDPASQVYVANKIKSCRLVGIESHEIKLPATISEAELLKNIERLNNDSSVDGILVQLPLPKGLSEQRALDAISPLKDVDCLSVENQGLLWSGRKRVASCTPWGVMKILDHYKIDVAGLNCVVIGRSRIVGRPMAHLLCEANATVTICHSKTRNLRYWTSQADLVVAAAGIPRFLGREDFKKDAIVIDVGIHRKDDGKLCGDVRYDELDGWAKAATPVPKGVGPMTIQILLENTLALARLSLG